MAAKGKMFNRRLPLLRLVQYPAKGGISIPGNREIKMAGAQPE
jgi:hypothetical protein